MMAFAALLTGALLSAACVSPARVIRPVIYADDDQAAAAMRTAPAILLVRIAGVRMTGDKRMVAKPLEVGGPNAPAIPLHLARITADVLLRVRGEARSTVEFYSWIWASGSHGGPRLFHPSPGGIRAVFLRNEAGYWHTVGDYPSYDFEFSSGWLPSMLSDWKSGQMVGENAPDRLVSLRLRAELERLTDKQLREDFGEDGPIVNHHWALDMYDLVRLAGPYFVATQLDDICLHSLNPSARFAACYLTAQYFPGRCEAYQVAQRATTDGFGGPLLARLRASCQAGQRSRIEDLRSGDAPRIGFYGASLSPPHRRETLRVYIAAMDQEVHRAGCEIAEATSGAGEFPECTDSRK